MKQPYKINRKQQSHRGKSHLIINNVKFKWTKTLIRRKRSFIFIQSAYLTICCLYMTQFGFKDTNRLNVKGWKNICHKTSNFKIKIVIKEKQTHFVIIKVSINQEDVTLNNRAPRYMKQKCTELKGKIYNSKTIVGVFNSHFQ